MAARVSEQAETRAYYAAQAALGAEIASSIRDFLDVLDPADIRGTFPDLRTIAAALGSRGSSAAIALAADYYTDLREALDAPGSFNVPIVDAPLMADLERSVDLLTGDLMASLDSVVDDIYLGELATQLAAEAEGAAQTAAADFGIEQLFAAMDGDREAKGWARVVKIGACSFCRMLATRGPVYATKASANFRAHTVVNGRGGVCQCTVEPLIGNAYEAPAQVRADTALWDQINAEGFRGAAARNEFRRRIEGRADGRRVLVGPQRDRRLASPAEVQGQRLGFDHLTVSQLTHHLGVIEALPDSTYRSQQIDRVRSRLAVLGATNSSR